MSAARRMAAAPGDVGRLEGAEGLGGLLSELSMPRTVEDICRC